jgi:hypothetical protein
MQNWICGSDGRSKIKRNALISGYFGFKDGFSLTIRMGTRLAAMGLLEN